MVVVHDSSIGGPGEEKRTLAMLMMLARLVCIMRLETISAFVGHPVPLACP